MMVLLRLSAGLIGWAAAFCLIYALHGLGCAGGWDRLPFAGLSVHRWTLLAAWAGSLAVTLVLALRLARHRATSLDRAAAALGWVGFAATLITFAPIAIVPSCA
ncbi:hypothetical protein [Sphingomonas paucimobilis]|uniref:hypothetical protein n=1 Tax=Sphingomonas paucimobilis TaxID=13689 RepID=UPI0028D77A33|nr:hypothetical protein [Sphingomonas paucimobilis]